MKLLVTVTTIALLSLPGCKGKDKPTKPTPAPKTNTGEAVKQQPPKEPEKPKVIFVKDVGFMTPESVLYDSGADAYLVSNINGSPFDTDDNGFISQVAPDGKVVNLKWIDGAKDNVTLNAPKGMAIAGDILYVSDITFVRKFDRKTGEPKGEIEIKNATFLNDLASGPDGAVYVSDSGLGPGFKPTGSDAVYKIDGDKAVAIIKDKGLGVPNGLLVDDTGVWVVTFGSGELYQVVDGKKQNAVKPSKGQLDGIETTADGSVLISSWEGQSVLRGKTAAGPFEEIISGVEQPADIGYDSKRNRVLIPLFGANEVQIHEL